MCRARTSFANTRQHTVHDNTRDCTRHHTLWQHTHRLYTTTHCTRQHTYDNTLTVHGSTLYDNTPHTT